MTAFIFTSHELRGYWCLPADFSPDYADTWESLERRIDDVMAVGKAAAQAGNLVSSLASNMTDMMSSFVPGSRR